MGVYINMEMPKNCGECLVGFCKQIGCDKYIGFDEWGNERHPDCPLAPVPKHGRLIDADALLQEHERVVDSWGLAHIVSAQAIRSAPTIIPAEKDGEK